jgi:FKBP-type peptidyl-prolyl cis-trans isomerase
LNKEYAISMKYIVTVIFAAIFAFLAASCERGNAGGAASQGSFGSDASYALGMNVGQSIMADNLDLDIEGFLQGVRDVLQGLAPRFSNEDAALLIYEAFNAMQSVHEAENRQAENAFLLQNSQRPGVIMTSSGLQYEIIAEGTGPRPTAFDTVRVHYEGSLVDGTVFDSSFARGEPIEFPLMAVIPGWTEGLQLMNVGSTFRLFIPSDLGYGPQGAQGIIPPFATLIFEVQLLDIIAAP